MGEQSNSYGEEYYEGDPEEKKKKVSQPSLSEQITFMSREPFARQLSEIMEVAPSKDSLREFAQRDPHLWAQMVTQFAKLAGYSDKLEMSGDLRVDAGNYSDSQLFDLIHQDPELRQILKQAIDGEVIEASEYARLPEPGEQNEDDD